MSGSEKNIWACELCFPDVTEIGHIAHNYYLCIIDGKYAILGGQGHKCDIIHSYDIVPYPLPDDESVYNKNKKIYEKFVEACKEIEKNKLLLHPMAGWELVKKCMEEAGYDPKKDGYNFDIWLFSYCGRLKEKYKNRKKAEEK